MPELPEVETVRAGLERHVVGRTVASAAVLNPRAVRRDLTGPEGFAAAMAGRTLLRAERRGKYLWISLGDGVGEQPQAAAGEALLAHLGMSGQLLVGDPQRPLSAHVRARFTFTDDGPDLRFTDQRTFGHLMMSALGEDDFYALPLRGDDPPAPDSAAVAVNPGRRLIPAPIAHIAPDPLEAAFAPDLFAARLTRKRTGLKRALLDQSLISGVGNIYADEALWRAKLHWARPTEKLRRPEITRLLDAVNEVLTEALKAGGTSFDALYVNVNGESGYFDRSLNAYGREGEPCARCGTPIRRDSFMNRSSYGCPRCQPRPRNPNRARLRQRIPAPSRQPLWPARSA
jgi:formamidopyrimidine-DNA glycosylase